MMRLDYRLEVLGAGNCNRICNQKGVVGQYTHSTTILVTDDTGYRCFPTVYRLFLIIHQPLPVVVPIIHICVTTIVDYEYL